MLILIYGVETINTQFQHTQKYLKKIGMCSVQLATRNFWYFVGLVESHCHIRRRSKTSLKKRSLSIRLIRQTFVCSKHFKMCELNYGEKL